MRRVFAVMGVVAIASTSIAQLSPFAINWSTYKSGQYSEIKTFSKFILRNQSDFATYWSTSTGNAAITAPKDIDWIKNEALAIHLGTRTSGGYSVSVRDIQMVRGDEYNVYAVEQIPPSKGVTTQALSSPFTIILLPRRYASYNIALEKKQAGGWTPGGGNGGWHDRDRDRGRGDDRDRDEGRRNGYRLIESGEFSVGSQQMKMDVARSYRDWTRFWDRTEDETRVTIYGRSRSQQIDWDKNQVLILQAGPIMSGGSVEVTRVRKTDNGYQVHVNVRSPGIVRANPRTSYPYFVLEVPGHTGKFDITVTNTRGM